MKILFVFPEYLVKAFRPIGISILSSYLKRAGHETDFFDASLYDAGMKFDNESPDLHLFKPVKEPRRFPVPSHKENISDAFMQRVRTFKPDLISISASYLQFRLCKEMLAGWKDRDIPVIVGGVHCTLNPEDVLSNHFVDMICIGEGDEALPELVKSMEAGLKRTDIQNIWFKDGTNIIKNPLRPLIKDLDDIPFVDWSMYPKFYFEKPYEGNWWWGGDLMSARGCYCRCNYCFYDKYVDLYGMKKNSVRFMSAKRFIEELEYVYKTYGVNLIKVRDSDFFARSTESIAEMAKLFNKKKATLPSLVLNAYPGTVTREKVKLVKKIKCLSVGIGIESGNEEIRSTYLQRYGSNEQFFKAVNLLKEHDIRVSSFNMMGIPTETRRNYFETVEMNRAAKVDLADISLLFPFPGTKIYDIVKSEGLLVKDWEDIAYFRSEAVLDMPQFSQEEMNGLVRVFSFYMNFNKPLWPFIKRAEKDDSLGRALYTLLVKTLGLKKRCYYSMVRPLKGFLSAKSLSQ